MASLRPALATPASRALIALATLGALVVAVPTAADAAQTPATCAPAVTLTNGSFEQPFVGYGTYAVLNQSSVPGWSTSASDQAIEIWGTPFLGVTATSGSQLAELNANEVATLYQDVTTQPGQVLKWSLDHRGRDGVDVMAVKLGSPSGALVQQGANIADGQTWGSHSGLYTVPAGQTTTRFAFESVSSVGGGGVGNLLDNIALGNAACVVTTKTVSNVDGSAAFEIGDTLEYTVTAENRGGTPATATVITDSLPAGLTFVPGSLTTDAARTDAAADDTAEISGSTITARVGAGATAVTGGSIPAGGSRTLTFRATVDSTSSTTTIRNEATTNYVDSLTGTAATSISNETATLIASAADLAVTQSLDTPLRSGQPATYTVSVTNNGPQSALDSTLTIDTPALDALAVDNAACTVTAIGIDCDFGTLANGATVTVHVTGTVPAATTGGTTLTLASEVATSTTDIVTTNDSATTPGVVASVATIGVTATIVDATPATTRSGESLTATYVVTNTGNVTLSAVDVTDPLFGSVTCESTTLAPGAFTACSADSPYLVTDADAAEGTVSTTVTATGVPPVGSGAAIATSTGVAAITVAALPADGSLAITGTDPAQSVLLALAMLLLGAGLVVFARRRSATV